MSPRVLLHIGAMKTGTSYLQGRLAKNQEALADARVLVASQRTAAVHDLIGFRGGRKDYLDRIAGTWDATVAEMTAWGGDVAVLSHEYLSFVADDVVDRAAQSLSGADLHVVLTLRDATSVLPAQWQTFARNRGTMTWPEYAAAAQDPETRPRAHTFIRSQRPRRTLRQWGRYATLHVVSVPPSTAGPDLLWERFATVLGVDPEAAPRRDAQRNDSVGYAAAHLMCLMHQHPRSPQEPPVNRIVLRRLAARLAARGMGAGGSGGRPMLDAGTLEFCSRWNERARDAVSTSGAHFVGDAQDLPVPAGREPVALAVPDDVAVLEAAAAAHAELQALAGETEPDPRLPDRWHGDVAAAVSDLVALVRRVGR